MIAQIETRQEYGTVQLLSNMLKKIKKIKSSSDQIHFSSENNVGESQVRQRTTLNFE